MAVSAFIENRDTSENSDTYFVGIYAVCDSALKFYWNEDVKSLIARYEEWFKQTILTGLYMWRRQL